MSGSLIITCEHAGNQVPMRYNELFPTDVLDSHRGWDPGALEVAFMVSEQLDVSCFTHQTTRLLVEINRSLGSPHLFSDYSQGLSDSEKQSVLDKYYFPYRLRVENAVAFLGKPVRHFSIHSFTPMLNEVIRTTDVGILFDPSREQETQIANDLRTALTDLLPGFNIDFNEPYKGVDDGFTTYLRTRFSDEEYAGIEIEINQRHVGQSLEIIATALCDVLRRLR